MKHLKTYNESHSAQYYDIQSGNGLDKRKNKQSIKKMMKQMKKPGIGKMKKFDDFLK